MGARGRLAVFVLLSCVASVVAPAQNVEQLDSQPPFRLSGSIGASVMANTMDGAPRRQAPFSWTTSASATAEVYGISIPFSFMLSERERSFQQPFNEFGMSPQWKWITVHAGYRSLYWSRYTNAGIRFLGAGVEAQSGDFFIGALYGRLQRAVEEDSTNRYAVPAYRRMGGGVHLGMGNEEGNLHGSFFMATDDTMSLQGPPPGVFPMQNATLGVGGLFHFVEGVSLEMDIGGSMLTSNLLSPTLEGTGMSGATQARRVKRFQDVFSIRTSSSLSFAGRATLTVALPSGGARLQCEVIEPDYTSFGAYYFQSDVMNITFAPSAVLLGGSLRVSASLGLQRDNVDRDKVATTTRWIGSLVSNYDPQPQYGIGLQYSNYSSGQAGARMPLNDSIRVRNVNQSIGLTPRYSFSSSAFRHTFFGMVTYMQFQDLNAFTRGYTESSTRLTTVSYTLAPANNAWSGFASFSMTQSRSALGTVRAIGVNIGATLAFFDRALQSTSSIGLSHLAGDRYEGSLVVTASVSLSYPTEGADRFTLNLSANQSNNGGGNAIPDFQELTCLLSYQRAITWNPFVRADVAPPQQ